MLNQRGKQVKLLVILLGEDVFWHFPIFHHSIERNYEKKNKTHAPTKRENRWHRWGKLNFLFMLTQKRLVKRFLTVLLDTHTVPCRFFKQQISNKKNWIFYLPYTLLIIPTAKVAPKSGKVIGKLCSWAGPLASSLSVDIFVGVGVIVSLLWKIKAFQGLYLVSNLLLQEDDLKKRKQ